MIKTKFCCILLLILVDQRRSRMPLDWLFGSKKKSEPDPTPHPEDKSNASGDEFVVLEADQTLLIRGDGSGMYPQLPYALAPKSQTNPESHTTPTTSALTHEVTTALGFLSGVPFKLTSIDTFEGIDSATAHHLRASQFISYVSENITTERFSYDFQVEKSVLHEAGCRDLG